MTRFTAIVACGLLLALPGSAAPRSWPQLAQGDGGVLHGSSATRAAQNDTIYLLGGPGRLDGKFEDAAGQPDWNGWTSEDLTLQPEAYWSVTAEPELVINGDWSLWCGVVYPEPGPIPVPGFGYGNGWRQSAVFSHTVAAPGADSDVVWSLVLRHDTEPGYDYVYLQWNRGGQWTTLASFDGVSPGTLDLQYAFTVPADQHVGPGGDRIELRIRFESDSIWSDEDGLWPTERGACQVDDIAVTVGGVLVSFADFEDGLMGDWVQVLDPGVGDYAQLWTNLGDLDPCVSNRSPQVAFIDDGIVVPGTGGTLCITWCYGPGGYIVNNQGGLAGPGMDFGNKLNNLVKSPVLVWPDHADAGQLAFDVYRHEELGAIDIWPGVFYAWHVRSTATGDPDDLAHRPWRSHGFVYYGGPSYGRHHLDISSLLEPDLTHLQVSLRALQTSSLWLPPGPDGTPAPYFDNVAVTAFARQGPAITARAIDLAQDGFPAQPALDFTDLASNAVRFDMAASIAPPAHGLNRPGDSIVVDVKALRAGSSLADRPQMHVKMRANPLFDGVRVLPPGFVHTPDGLIEGWVYGDTTYNAQGGIIADRWHFDLPDADFFFPGDVIHYHVAAADDLGGVSTLPGDLQGFGDFAGPHRYARDFVVRALPTLLSATPGDQPRILFWDDADGVGADAWLHALQHNGHAEGLTYDRYVTRGAASGVGNGLGGRATAAHLDHYDVLLYTCGDLAQFTLSNGDPAFDPGDDIGLVRAFLTQGKRALLAGDDLVHSLLLAGAAGQALVSDFLGVSLVDRDLRPLIQNQVAPRVRPIADGGYFTSLTEWVVHGGCPRLARVDAVTAVAAARLAEFTGPDGQPGAYPYAAVTRHVDPAHGAVVVLLPYDLALIDHAPGLAPPPSYAGWSTRSLVLHDILQDFGQASGPPTAAPVAAAFTVGSHPNPLNPATTIRLGLPRDGAVSVKVYDLRGALVRTLVDEPLTAGVHELVWDGRNDRGAAVASGVYFYEVRHGGKVKVGKLTVLK